MLKQTKYLGEIEIDPKQIIEFPYGLPGFLEEREFALLEFPGNAVFHILQSMKNSELAFIVTNPYGFDKDYTFDLDEQILENLKIEKPEDVLVFTIVTVKEPFTASTYNLKAPIIVHSTKKIAKQYIINKGDYKSRAPLVKKEKGE